MSRSKIAGTAATLVAGALLSACGATSVHAASGNTIRRPDNTTGFVPPAPSATKTTLTTTTTTTPPPSTDATFPPTVTALLGLNRSNPTAVAVAMLDSTFSYNTNLDKSPQAALERSAVWYTPSAAKKLAAAGPQGSPGKQWTTWSQHHVITTVTVSAAPDSGAPPETSTSAYRQFAVTVTPHGSNGWTAPPELYACFVTLTNTSVGWQVASLDTDQ